MPSEGTLSAFLASILFSRDCADEEHAEFLRGCIFWPSRIKCGNLGMWKMGRPIECWQRGKRALWWGQKTLPVETPQNNKTGTARHGVREDVFPFSWRSDKTLRTCCLSSPPLLIALCYLTSLWLFKRQKYTPHRKCAHPVYSCLSLACSCVSVCLSLCHTQQ